MTISNLEEIESPCGYVFEAELFSAISISDNPELKSVLMEGGGELMLYPALNVKKYFMPSVLFFTMTEKINYEPLMLFGIEDLVSLLHSERDVEDE